MKNIPLWTESIMSTEKILNNETMYEHELID